MEAVIDTVVIQHLVRKPTIKKCRNGGKIRDCYETVLDSSIRKGNLILGLDKGNGLISEWQGTCGVELIRQLMIRWQDLSINVIKIVDKLPKIPHHVNRKLLAFGFNGTVDKLILKIAVDLDDSIVVSNDSDFWDPKKPTVKKIKGNPNAPVAKLCYDDLGVEILLLSQLLARL